MTAAYDHYYAWRPRWGAAAERQLGSPFGDRKGQECRVLARGGKNSVLVQFRDGHVACVSRFAIRRITASLQVSLFPPRSRADN